MAVSEDVMPKLGQIVTALAKLGYNLEELLEGFQLYQDNKNTLDISMYEKADTMYKSGIIAMREQIDNFYALLMMLQVIVEASKS
jgi:ArsR family metal-binding transcriptional regulator